MCRLFCCFNTLLALLIICCCTNVSYADGISFKTPWNIQLEEFADQKLGVYIYDTYTISNIDKKCNGNIAVYLTDSTGKKEICNIKPGSSCQFTEKPPSDNSKYNFTVQTIGTALICNQNGILSDQEHCINLKPGRCGFMKHFQEKQVIANID